MPRFRYLAAGHQAGTASSRLNFTHKKTHRAAESSVGFLHYRKSLSEYFTRKR
jgi:hypothetical protein